MLYIDYLGSYIEWTNEKPSVTPEEVARLKKLKIAELVATNNRIVKRRPLKADLLGAAGDAVNAAEKATKEGQKEDEEDDQDGY